MSKPAPDLEQELTRVAAIKAEMTKLLAQLEAAATGQPIEKPGLWRHHPVDWTHEHLSGLKEKVERKK